MLRKKQIIIGAIALALVGGTGGAIYAHSTDNANKTDLEKVADSVENALGEDCKKQSMTELAATITYGDGKDKEIFYRILKTTYYEAEPEEVTGLNTEALRVLFEPDSADSCDEMMIKDWNAALYKFGEQAYLCWTYSPEVNYVLDYKTNEFDDSEILKMAESAEVAE